MEPKMEFLVCDCYCNDGDVEKKNNSPVTVVLKVDFHCDGCIARIVSFARCLEGVETVRVDPIANKLTLIGFSLNPVKITEKLQEMSKKKIELVSPKPKKETKDTKADKLTTTTMVAVSTVILKLSCACDGCTKRIEKTISKTKGVYEVKIDKEKELVTVTGTMEVKTVTENLKRKLRKTVHVLPEKKKKDKDNNKEGITKGECPGLPGYGFGHYGFMEGGFFSEEDQSFCRVM